jgi:F-type H+-transporting ATPase subunit a
LESSAAAPKIDALGQFRLEPALGVMGQHLAFSQSNVMMIIAALLILGILVVGMRARSVVPDRAQALAEMAYESLMNMCVDQIGPEGKKFFPFVFTLFFFILFGNLLGLLPFSFTFTSHIAVTFALALMVFLLFTGVSIWIHRLHFFSYFFPKGAPVLLAPLIIPVEIISYLSRLVSLPVRLFANMVAGHVMFEVFATFTVLLGGAGLIGGVAAIFPLGINVILMGFELLVAFLQAYVFAILTCIYLHDAVHLH